MRKASCVMVASWALIGWAALLAWPAEAAVAEAPAAKAADVKDQALYDPEADPAEQLAAAIEEATASGRRIILEVGGNWCIWCHHLHDFMADHDGIRKLWDESFVTVNVNVSPENRNETFLGAYPEIPGYPHLFVLAPDGTLLHSQNTGDLERGESYSRASMLDFISQWAPPDLGR